MLFEISENIINQSNCYFSMDKIKYGTHQSAMTSLFGLEFNKNFKGKTSNAIKDGKIIDAKIRETASTFKEKIENYEKMILLMQTIENSINHSPHKNTLDTLPPELNDERHKYEKLLLEDINKKTKENYENLLRSMIEKIVPELPNLPVTETLSSSATGLRYTPGLYQGNGVSTITVDDFKRSCSQPIAYMKNFLQRMHDIENPPKLPPTQISLAHALEVLEVLALEDDKQYLKNSEQNEKSMQHVKALKEELKKISKKPMVDDDDFDDIKKSIRELEQTFLSTDVNLKAKRHDVMKRILEDPKKCYELPDAALNKLLSEIKQIGENYKPSFFGKILGSENQPVANKLKKIMDPNVITDKHQLLGYLQDIFKDVKKAKTYTDGSNLFEQVKEKLISFQYGDKPFFQDINTNFIGLTSDSNGKSLAWAFYNAQQPVPANQFFETLDKYPNAYVKVDKLNEPNHPINNKSNEFIINNTKTSSPLPEQKVASKAEPEDKFSRLLNNELIKKNFPSSDPDLLRLIKNLKDNLETSTPDGIEQLKKDNRIELKQFLNLSNLQGDKRVEIKNLINNFLEESTREKYPKELPTNIKSYDPDKELPKIINKTPTNSPIPEVSPKVEVKPVIAEIKPTATQSLTSSQIALDANKIIDELSKSILNLKDKDVFSYQKTNAVEILQKFTNRIEEMNINDKTLYDKALDALNTKFKDLPPLIKNQFSNTYLQLQKLGNSLESSNQYQPNQAQVKTDLPGTPIANPKPAVINPNPVPKKIRNPRGKAPMEDLSNLSVEQLQAMVDGILKNDIPNNRTNIYGGPSLRDSSNLSHEVKNNENQKASPFQVEKEAKKDADINQEANPADQDNLENQTPRLR